MHTHKQKNNGMKKVVSDFIKSFGVDTGYSGSLRTMYIQKGERSQEAFRAVRDKWPNLAFYVRVTEEIPEEAKEENKYLPSLTTEELKELPAPDLTPEVILTEVSSKDAAVELRSKVDEYLIKYQNNKNEKGFYTAAAKFLNTTNEYVRDRYRKLVKKGTIVENKNTVIA